MSELNCLHCGAWVSNADTHAFPMTFTYECGSVAVVFWGETKVRQSPFCQGICVGNRSADYKWREALLPIADKMLKATEQVSGEASNELEALIKNGPQGGGE